MSNRFGIVAHAIRSLRHRSRTLVRLWRIRLRARWDGLPPLPPGLLQTTDHGFWTDDLYLLRKARRFGPVFKTTIAGQMVTCVVDHQRSNRILSDYADRLAAVDAPYNRLIPGGFLRNQTGDAHQATRRTFARALQADSVKVNATALRAIARRELAGFAAAAQMPDNDALIRTLDRIATAMLLLVFYGVRQGDKGFDSLMAGYARLGPKELVWEVGPDQASAMADLTAAARVLIDKDPNEHAAQSVVSELVAGAFPITDTIVGNLIYMVEMGRYDLHCLFHWIVKYLSEAPDVVAAIRAQALDARALATASVLETLRLSQSESVTRRVGKGFAFEGWGIPRRTYLRACMREPHRDPVVFPDPDRFDPSRFIGRSYSSDAYSPFGFAHHQCIAGDLVVKLAALFVETLIDGFDWAALADGPSRRGFYHWMPSASFAIRLTPRPVSAS